MIHATEIGNEKTSPETFHVGIQLAAFHPSGPLQARKLNEHVPIVVVVPLFDDADGSERYCRVGGRRSRECDIGAPRIRYLDATADRKARISTLLDGAPAATARSPSGRCHVDR